MIQISKISVVQHNKPDSLIPLRSEWMANSPTSPGFWWRAIRLKRNTFEKRQGQESRNRMMLHNLVHQLLSEGTFLSGWCCCCCCCGSRLEISKPGCKNKALDLQLTILLFLCALLLFNSCCRPLPLIWFQNGLPLHIDRYLSSRYRKTAQHPADDRFMWRHRITWAFFTFWSTSGPSIRQPPPPSTAFSSLDDADWRRAAIEQLANRKTLQPSPW